MTYEQARQLYVADLPDDVTMKFVQTFFAQAGAVEDIVLRSDRMGRPICHAFVTFNTHQAAKRAMTELNYTKLNGVPIRMSWADAETDRIRKSKKGALLIKNLDPRIEVAQLHDAFENFGEVISCKIATDAEGKSLGCGFVQFREEKDAVQAMQDLKEATINGRPVQIEPYLKRQR